MIKFRQKQYTEVVSSESDNNSSSIEYEGGVLAPTLVAGGIGSMVYGKKKLNKAKKIDSKVPNSILNIAEKRLEGEKKVKEVEQSWKGFGKFLRKDKINKIKEAAEKAVENEKMKTRKLIRSSKWNKAKGKAAIGLGIGATALGAYKLNKQIKRNKED